MTNFDNIKQFCDENAHRFIRGRRFILYDFAEALVKWCNNINNEMKAKEETKNRIIFKNCFLSTENPDPNSWIRSFLKEELWRAGYFCFTRRKRRSRYQYGNRGSKRKLQGWLRRRYKSR